MPQVQQFVLARRDRYWRAVQERLKEIEKLSKEVVSESGEHHLERLPRPKEAT